MNSIVVEYEKKEYSKIISKTEVIGFLQKILAEIKLDNVEFSVSFIDENHMHLLNKEYRNIDDSTDILSFAVEDSDGFDFIVKGRKKRNIGDMLICPEVCSRNAGIFNVSENEEMRRLLIHGVLHLSGMNHTTNDMSEPMLVKQEEILKKIN